MPVALDCLQLAEGCMNLAVDSIHFAVDCSHIPLSLTSISLSHLFDYYACATPRVKHYARIAFRHIIAQLLEAIIALSDIRLEELSDIRLKNSVRYSS